jgi:hypothetical protein
MMCLLAAAVTIVGSPSAVYAQAEQAPQAIPIIIDVSGSMAGKRIDAAKEGAKLAVAILDSHQQVVVVDFNNTARRAAFALLTPNQRLAAMAHIDALHADAGTNYLAALQTAALSPHAPAIFLSDGEHNGSPAEVLDFLKANPAGPLFTVAIEAPPKAAKLLAEMAAITGGTFVAVENSEALVKTLVGIAQSLAHYRSYQPREELIRCRGARGKIIAFGFDAVPALTVAGAPAKLAYEHLASLPGEQVRLAALDLPSAADLVIQATQKRSPQGRLGAILRQDLVRAKMDVAAPGGKAAAGADLRVTTTLTDRDGLPVDPRRRPDVSSDFQLFDQDGRLIHKVTAKPSPTEPVLEATLPLPRQAGPVTIKNISTDASSGVPFTAEESRTVILQKPLPLAADPAQINLSVKPGQFTTTLKLKAPSVDLAQAVISTRLEGADKGLRLIQAPLTGDTLTLHLEVTRPGTSRAAVLIHGSSNVPLEPVRVPLHLTVARPILGLSLPAVRELVLGPILANSGSKAIATLTIPSLDAEPADYTLDVGDLSDGAAVIPLRADAVKIRPTKDQPARVTLTADLGNVPAGEFGGTVTIKLAASGGKEWQTKLTLTVTEPLTVEPLDFGKVEVGKVIKGSLRIKNAGEALRDLRLDKMVLKAKEGDVIATFPDKIALLPARQDKEIPFTLAVSPLAQTRGRLQGTLAVRRVAGQELSVPIDLHVVGVGEGPTSLRAAPGKVQLTVKQGEVRQFDVRIKYAADAPPAVGEELKAEASGFKDAAGRASTLEVAFKWAPSSRLTPDTPITLQGFFIAPRPGLYTGTLTIRSPGSGTVLVPISIDVQ